MGRSSKASLETDPRFLRSRKALRDALLKLLKTKSFEEITIREIAATAGIAYTTFFRHHPTKESLLDGVAADEIATLVAISFPLLEAVNTRAACTALCAYVDQNRPLWTTLLTGGAANVLRSAFIEESKRITMARPKLRSRLPPDLGNTLIASSVLEVLRWWLAQKKPSSTAAVAEILDDYVVAPVVKPK